VKQTTQDDRPWWQYRMLWLVVGAPAAVVVASFATLATALSHPDPVLPTAPAAADDSAAPAQQARNHAAGAGRQP
jgi:uncharacterized protein